MFATPASRYIQVSVFGKNSPSYCPFLFKYIYSLELQSSIFTVDSIAKNNVPHFEILCRPPCNFLTVAGTLYQIAPNINCSDFESAHLINWYSFASAKQFNENRLHFQERVRNSLFPGQAGVLSRLWIITKKKPWNTSCHTAVGCCSSRQNIWCFFYFYFFFAYLSEKDLPHNGKLLVILSGRIKTLIL